MIKRFSMFKVVSAHGLKGDLKCFPLSESVDLLKGRERLFVSETDEKPLFHLKTVKPNGKFRLISLQEVTTREEAEALSGQTFIVAREALPEPEEGTWFLADLMGFAVYEDKGDQKEPLGRMREILYRPGQDLLVIDRGKKADLYVPAVKAFLKDVDMETREIRLTLPEGLLELYESR